MTAAATPVPLEVAAGVNDSAARHCGQNPIHFPVRYPQFEQAYVAALMSQNVPERYDRNRVGRRRFGGQIPYRRTSAQTTTAAKTTMRMIATMLKALHCSTARTVAINGIERHNTRVRGWAGIFRGPMPTARRFDE